MQENTIRLSKADLDGQLNDALKDSFPASDPVTIGAASAGEPDRPLHRRPAKLDTDLVNELARNVEAAHAMELEAVNQKVDLQRDTPRIDEDPLRQPGPSPIERKPKSGNAEQRALSDAVSDLDSRD